MSLQHLILGILKYGPMSGYDLNKAFRASVQHFWDTDQSMIYRALHKMHELDWIAVEVVTQEDLPAKKLYSLKVAGWTELRRWLQMSQSIPAPHEAWLGQLFFGSELTTDQLRQLLNARIAAIKALLNHYEQDVPASVAYYADLFQATADKDFWALTLDYGIERMRFDLQWAERALRQIENRSGEKHSTNADAESVP